MALSLAQTQYVAELAGRLYSYLPGSSRWPRVYTFSHAATESGLQRYWQPGSKLPAITALLEATLEFHQERVVPLIERIVRHGLKYRAKQRQPVTRDEVVAINRLVRALGLREGQLAYESFLATLPDSTSEPTSAAAPVSADDGGRKASLAVMRGAFLDLYADADRPRAGRKLEGLLNSLFVLEQLSPRGAFRVVGEQIDGSFEFTNDVYLLEAKWTAERTPVEDLYVFREKVTGKSAMTQGLFLSVNGYVVTASEAITRGRQAAFIMIDGSHLHAVLDGAMSLTELLGKLRRGLAESGNPYISMRDLWGG